MVRTPRGGIALDTRKQANQVRDSLPKRLQSPTIEVIPLRAITDFIADWQEMLPAMAATLKPGELAVQKACIQDLIDRVKTI